jgi:hypothetical protein
MITNFLAIIEKAQSIAPTKAHVDLLSEALRSVGKERDDALRRCSELEERLRKLERPATLIENMGVLWKRTATGFELHPYCRECSSHPIMTLAPPSRPMFWMCSEGHQAPRSVVPPTS